jgi:L-alanine-DL-glutamate epimerase-like enolase superfamily enzyme
MDAWGVAEVSAILAIVCLLGAVVVCYVAGAFNLAAAILFATGLVFFVLTLYFFAVALNAKLDRALLAK